jgi:hypothetical protein
MAEPNARTIGAIMNPSEAMAEAIEQTVFSITCSSSLRPNRGRPGEMIEHMRPEVREALKNMTSDDAQNVRFEWWMIEPIDDGTKRYKEEFDKKIMACRQMHSPYASNVIYLRLGK